MNTISKKRILIITGVILAVIALVDLGISDGNNENTVVTKIIMAVLPKSPEKYQIQEVIPHTPPPSLQQKKLPKFSITNDPALLKGEGFFYVEDGVLYRRKIKDGVAAQESEKIAEGIQWVMAQSEKLTLFTVKADGSSSLWNNELWLVDKETGTARKVYEDVLSAQISPQGNTLAVSQYGTEELHLIDENGNLLNKIGIHGGYAVFSPDGKKLAYHKLADTSQDGGRTSLLENAYGISVYDMKTSTEFLATDHAGDYRPVGFSPDGTYLYFLSGSDRGDSQALWSVDLKSGGEAHRLSEEGVSVYVNHANAIWSSDRLSVVSETDGEISLVQILPDQKSASVASLGEGTSPRWKIQDKIIEFKGKDAWKTVDVASFLKK